MNYARTYKLYTYNVMVNGTPLTPIVAIWVQLYRPTCTISCQTGLSRHLRALILRAKHQSARMSKITNDSLIRSGTGCLS